MTSTQQTQLDAAWAEYTSKKDAYTLAVQTYNAFKSLPVAQKYKDLMDAAKIAQDSAFTAFNTLRDTISAADQAAFNAANPTAAVQIAQTQAQAQADTASAQALGKAKEVETLAKAEIESQAAVFAAKNKQVILWGGVIVLVIVVFGVVYLKFVRKQKP